MLNKEEVRTLFHSSDATSVVTVVTFRVDGVAQELNETVILELVPSGAVNVPTGEGIFFRRTIEIIIMDSDSRF